MMTRKDLVAIAKAIATEVNKPSETISEMADRKIVCHNVASNIADVAQKSNPNFDRGRFMKACGLAHSHA